MWITLSRGSAAAISSMMVPVASSLRSSMAITSNAGQSCARADARQARMRPASSLAGIRTVTCGGCGGVGRGLSSSRIFVFPADVAYP